MDSLLLDNQIIILEGDTELDVLKQKIRKMEDILVKFTHALTGIFPQYFTTLDDLRNRMVTWENSMNQAETPKSLYMCELVRHIDQIRAGIEKSQVDFGNRDSETYIQNVFCVDVEKEYEPLYLLRPAAVDFIGIWNNPETTLSTKKNIINYLYLINEFARSIMNSFSVMDKDEFEEKFGFDYANFDIDNMNFNVKSISESFAKMVKTEDEQVDTNPLTETVNTVLSEFLGVENPDQNINLKTLQEIHSKQSGDAGGLYNKLDRISEQLDKKGISDQDLLNSVKNLSMAFTKNSKVKNPQMKALFEKLSNGIDLENPDTLIECQKMMHENPFFQQMGLSMPPMPVPPPAPAPVKRSKKSGQKKK
jgi:hypothetical protein